MASLPSYVALARPVPLAARVPWYKSTAQTYAGILLWFAFWELVPGSGATAAGGILAQGLGIAVLGVVLGALLCHFACYLCPGMLGMKTGLPLAVVGTSTYGVRGGFLMPGFFMGIVQFGGLAVNSFFSAELLARLAGQPEKSASHLTIGCVWAVVAMFVGLKGIHYVAKVATYLPLIPLVILLVLAARTLAGVGNFKPEQLIGATTTPPDASALVLLAIAYSVGFFATAGSAGVDIASSNRDQRDVQLGGLVGVTGATIFVSCLALLIVAGAYGGGLMKGNPEVVLKPTELMEVIVGPTLAKIFWLLLAIAAFPGACFSSLISAASFKTTLPRVHPFISCGVGTAGSIVLILTGWAGEFVAVFGLLGAIFGPVCGAMAADYLLAGRRWAGPRAGFNPAGWISWVVGFTVGAWTDKFLAGLFSYLARLAIEAGLPAWMDKLLAGLFHSGFQTPCAPLAAILVGFAVYVVLAKLGLESRRLEMPAA